MTWLALGVFVPGCTGVVQETDDTSPQHTDSDTDTVPVDTDTAPVETDTGPIEPPVPDCDPPLLLRVDPPVVLPYGVGRATATGGTGAYHFSLDTASGGEIDPQTGWFIAGSTPAIDTVSVTDDACVGEAAQTLTVAEPLDVHPQHIQLAPGQSFTPAVEGGSGTWSCSGNLTGILADCLYTADTVGEDRIHVLDAITGESSTIWIDVAASPTFDVVGRHFYVPLGSAIDVRSVGGSEELTLTADSGDITIDGSRFIGDVPGRSVVRAQDSFLPGFHEQITVDVLAPLGGNGPRDQDGAQPRFRAADLDGDGVEDLVIAVRDVSVNAYNGGGVFVYRGVDGGGYEPVPAQILGGAQLNESFGRDVLLTDIDGDELVDLVVGASGSSRGGSGNGAVYIYFGLPEGFFDETPGQILPGVNSGDGFGYNLAACDINDDGYMDIFSGAPNAEDTTVQSNLITYDQGALVGFLGGAFGYDLRPSFVRYGKIFSDAAWVSKSSLLFGRGGVVAGDFDGDGGCELAVGADYGNWDGAGEDGVIQMFSPDSSYTITRTPVRILAPIIGAAAPTTSLAGGLDYGTFGRRLAAGDIDGDGADELVVNWPQASLNGHTSRGAFAIFRGGTLPIPPAASPRIDPLEADLIVEGSDNYDQFGYDLQLVHDDVGALQLVVGAVYDEVLTPPSDTGALIQFSNATLVAGLESGVATPDHRYGGTVNSAIFGAAVGGGTAGIAAITRDEVLEGSIAASWSYVGTDDTLTRVSLPWPASGSEISRGMALFDGNGDGNDDGFVGAPAMGRDGRRNVGSGLLQERSGDGWDVASVAFTTHPNTSASENYGWSMSRTDFDGDGRQDLAVVARYGSRFGSNDTTSAALYDNPSECPSTNTSSQGSTGQVWIYRGTANGLDPNPAWVWFGPMPSNKTGGVYMVRGGLDVNGDNKGDFVVSSPNWPLVVGTTTYSNQGGAALLRGRAPGSSGKPVILCPSTTPLWYGATPDPARSTDQPYFGYSVAPMGDLNNDGCDEFIVGGGREDASATSGDQGTARVFWGFGSGCSSSEVKVTSLYSQISGSYAGQSVDGGGDFDGDGIPDGVVGGWNAKASGSTVGRVWVLPGSYLNTLPKQALITDATAPTGKRLPTVVETTWSSFYPNTGRWSITGDTADSRFGIAVAFVDDPLVNGRSALAIGAPFGDGGGQVLGGSAGIWRFDTDEQAFEATPWGIVAGEASPLGELGGQLWSSSLDGVPALLIGAARSDAIGLDQGAGYVLEVE